MRRKKGSSTCNLCHNMPLPLRQHTFLHTVQRICVYAPIIALYHHQGKHLWVNFMPRIGSKTEEVGARDFKIGNRPTTRWFLYTPLYTTCMRGYKKDVEAGILSNLFFVLTKHVNAVVLNCVLGKNEIAFTWEFWWISAGYLFSS